MANTPSLRSSSLTSFFGQATTGTVDVRAFLVVVVLLVMVMDCAQLIFAFVGALTYAAIQFATAPTRAAVLEGQKCRVDKASVQTKPVASRSPRLPAAPPIAAATTSVAARTPLQQRSTATPAATPPAPQQQPCTRQPSSKPVAPPVFTSTGWDAEVEELSRRLAASPASDAAVQKVVRFISSSLASIVPDMEVLGCAAGDLSCGTACCVAVPEVEIVLRASPEVLARRFCARGGNARHFRPGSPEALQLQKSAVRACTDRLVGTGHVKFRRSAFRGAEPKVTLLVSASLGVHSEAIPIDLSINGTNPLRNAAVLSECERMEPMSKALALLVKRWAKDRGICHAAKGHLAPYAWTLLAIYFLQVGLPHHGPVLPALRNSELCSAVSETGRKTAQPRSSSTTTTTPLNLSLGATFKEFIRFYRHEFDCRREAVCVMDGRRAAPLAGLPLTVVERGDQQAARIAPTIQDPLEPTRNLSADLTASTYGRWIEEFARADDLCNKGCSLTELLEPWVPPGPAEGSA